MLSDRTTRPGLVHQPIQALGHEPGRITCPTMVVVGEHDTSSPLSAAQHLRDSIAGSTLHVIPGAAHMSVLEKPEAVNALLLSFLGTVW